MHLPVEHNLHVERIKESDARGLLGHVGGTRVGRIPGWENIVGMGL